MGDVNTKPGTFPLGDRPNRYGTHYQAFYEAWGKIHAMQLNGSPTQVCWPHFRGALGIAKAAARHHGNAKFLEFLKKIDLSKPNIEAMDAVLHECEFVMNEIGSYDYGGTPWDEDQDGEEEDVTSAGGEKPGVPEVRPDAPGPVQASART